MSLIEITYNTLTNTCLGYYPGDLPTDCSRILIDLTQYPDIIEHPEYWEVIDLAPVRKDQATIDGIIAAKAATNQAETDRVTDIIAAQTTVGLRDLTVDEARAIVDDIIDPATDIDTLKAAVKTALKKMLPYVLLQ